MKKPIKIILASAVVMAYLFSPGAALAATSGSVELIPLAQEDGKAEENVKTTPMEVYGRRVSGTPEEVKAYGTPEGMLWWTGGGSWDGKTSSDKSLFLSPTKISEETAAAQGLIALGGIEIPYFYVSEQIEGREDPIIYVRDGLNGPGTVLFPVCWDEAVIYVMENPITSEKRVVDFKTAEKMLAGEYGTDGVKWDHKGFCDKNTALREGVSISPDAPSHDSARNDFSGVYSDRLTETYIYQDVPGMGR